MFKWIGFDADDTLWHNEATYQKARDRFEELLRSYPLQTDPHRVMDNIEIHNLRYYGYGAMSFVLSLIETAIQVTDEKISAADIQALLDLGKKMLSDQVTLMANVHDILDALSRTYPLMLITKGDLQHQLRKLDGSGLRDHFQVIEVVSEKNQAVYREIMERHSVDPQFFLMIGNSLRSDVLPVLKLGGRAVHLENDLSWAHEETEIPWEYAGKYLSVERLSEVLNAIEKFQDG
jgi:putative hydrolase of the HAD superfamily